MYNVLNSYIFFRTGSAFPNAISLRYKEHDDKQHHILCRDNVFKEPDGGWHVSGRVYLVVNSGATSFASMYSTHTIMTQVSKPYLFHEEKFVNMCYSYNHILYNN